MGSGNESYAGLQHRVPALESRREREFYRYYEPIRALSQSGPPFCDLHDQVAVKAHKPFSSPDAALTALCQLAALRMRTKRAMLFFFDVNYAYILAEATRSLSLQDDTQHEIEDQLWLGHSIIPRGFSVCEHTVNLPWADEPDAEPSPVPPLHIINDLREDTRFCDRPFVTDAPNARFYAGVPITTSAGLSIGAFCVLDDKVRPGVDEKDQRFLREMSATVMTHLEMVRAKAEHERGTRMVAGLSSFVQGTWNPASPYRSGAAPLPGIESKSFAPSNDGSSMPAEARRNSQANGASRVVESLSEEVMPASVKNVFLRAAKLTQEALNVDGVLFVDAPAVPLHGLTEEPEQSSEPESELSTVETDLSSAEVDSPSSPSAEVDDVEKSCLTLGASYATTRKHHIPHEERMKALLRRYPRGKVWNFDESGVCSDDESPSEPRVRPAREPVSQQGRIAPPKRRVRVHKTRRAADAVEIQRLFPGARSVSMVGMWNHSRQRWFAGCLVWTYSPLRILSLDGDVSYMAAFCDVLMAEVHRLEVQKSEKAKTDFISSISHELRSPLHGILGSVECLQDQPIDQTGRSLVSQIESCGLTLLDIIDHLLDFSKINFFARNKELNPMRGQRYPAGNAQQDDVRILATAPQENDVALDRITEDVIETAVYSYCCSRDQRLHLDRRVSVILDLDRSDDFDWNCRIETGAWKRLCINLVSNSLKYTSEGFIKISLKPVPIPNKRRSYNAVLTVSDSGRGMSKDFMQHHLFEPFSQEDSFAEGTGLGMSLVSKIVRTFKGKVEVQSEKGIGTEFKITIPIEKNRSPKDGPSRAVVPAEAATSTVNIGIVSLSDQDLTKQPSPQAIGRTMLLGTLEKTCSIPGFRHTRVSWTDPHDSDVLLVTESDLMQLSHEDQTSPKPLIVLCDNALSERTMRVYVKAKFDKSSVECISQPFGPHRLFSAIQTVTQAAEPASVNGEGYFGGKRALQTDSPRDVFLTSVDTPESNLPPALRLESEAAIRGPTLETSSPANTTTGFPFNVDRSDISRSDTTGLNRIVESIRSVSLQSPDASPGSPTDREASGLSLLLVDDNDINLQLLETYARKSGHSATTARHGLQAVEAYKNLRLRNSTVEAASSTVPTAAAAAATQKQNDGGSPQVVLMDINMPVMDGFEATRRIRMLEQQHRLRPAVVIALTGLGSADAQREARASGIDLFLTKPVRLKELTKILNDVQV